MGLNTDNYVRGKYGTLSRFIFLRAGSVTDIGAQSGIGHPSSNSSLVFQANALGNDMNTLLLLIGMS